VHKQELTCSKDRRHVSAHRRFRGGLGPNETSVYVRTFRLKELYSLEFRSLYGKRLNFVLLAPWLLGTVRSTTFSSWARFEFFAGIMKNAVILDVSPCRNVGKFQTYCSTASHPRLVFFLQYVSSNVMV
jgi:hypothetical protein